MTSGHGTVRRAFLAAGVAGSALCCLAGPETSAATTAILLADWRSKYRLTKCVSYVAKGTGFVARHGFGTLPGSAGPAPPTDVEYEVECRWVLDFAGRRFRVDRSEPVWAIGIDKWNSTQRSVIVTPEQVTTVRRYRVIQTNEPKVKTTREPVASNTWVCRRDDDLPVFWQHGVVGLGTTNGLEPPADDLLLWQWDIRSGIPLHASKSLTVQVRQPGSRTHYQLGIDQSRGGAITEYRLYDNGVLRHDVQAQYTDGDREVALVRWQSRHFRGNTLSHLSSLSVVDVKVGVTPTERLFHSSVDPLAP